jgi:hypothetical protein
MKTTLESIILFVQNVDLLKDFYSKYFLFDILEEIDEQWVLLNTGTCNLGLHKIGTHYEADTDWESNTKLVFVLEEDIFQVREDLFDKGVAIGEVKSFEGYPYWLCDGQDPEKNVFQLKQKKKSF